MVSNTIFLQLLFHDLLRHECIVPLSPVSAQPQAEDRQAVAAVAAPLTPSDRRLLTLLQQDAALGRQELADAAGLSATTVWRRITELQNSGVIRKRVALLDAARIGYRVCVFVFVNMAGHDRKTREDFEQFVADSPEVMECYSVTGAHDYTLIVRCRSVESYERLLMEKILAHRSVATATSQIALREHKYTTALPLTS